MTGEISVTHEFDGFSLDASFRLGPRVTALFGPSGAGKTTIVNAIAGFLTPSKGKIAISGRTLLDTTSGIILPVHARRVSVVFQDARLFPHLSVKQNLLYGRLRRPGTVSPAFDEIVALLGLEGLLDRRPRTLSGGEKSRVALGRALLAGPLALLLDEPLASLDAERKSEILPYLERLTRDAKIPVLFVSHSTDEVARLADDLVLLKNGRVQAEGSMFELMTRLDLFSGGYLHPGSVLSARVESHDREGGLSLLSFAGGRLFVPYIARRVGEEVRVRIQAEDVMLALREPGDISANNVLQGKIAEVRVQDGHADVRLAIGTSHLVARVTCHSLERLRLVAGQTVFALIKSVSVAERLHG
ncbi:MAG: molybdenum ABC transporter ATP-binding protein [Alphaproteobacteria bacterium]